VASAMFTSITLSMVSFNGFRSLLQCLIMVCSPLRCGPLSSSYKRPAPVLSLCNSRPVRLPGAVGPCDSSPGLQDIAASVTAWKPARTVCRAGPLMLPGACPGMPGGLFLPALSRIRGTVARSSPAFGSIC
jgi:hypothetical protein